MTVIVINLWVGIPYTLLQVTGILQNIPGELYEAAKIDGANAVQIFFKITLPYMLFVMTPYLITQFTGNINNFNVIYLLSGGNPTPVDATAGKTDLLVTWLYKLTVDKNYYNLGAVIGIMTFIVLAIVALVTYRNTASYKDEEGIHVMSKKQVTSGTKAKKTIVNIIIHIFWQSCHSSGCCRFSG